MESELIDYPDLSACYIDRDHDRVWIVFYHCDKEIHIVIDPYQFIEVINNKKIEQIKELLINKIKEK